jgi:hypothetical protein
VKQTENKALNRVFMKLYLSFFPFFLFLYYFYYFDKLDYWDKGLSGKLGRVTTFWQFFGLLILWIFEFFGGKNTLCGNLNFPPKNRKLHG